MKKVLVICGKDLLLLFRDRAAWILMLAAPIALTLGLGAVTGAFSSRPSAGLQNIPVVVFDQDQGRLGSVLVEALKSKDLANLFEPSEAADEASARRQVEENKAAAAIIIPAGFSASLLPDQQTGEAGPAAPVEVYGNPARPISSSAVQSVVREIVNRIEAAPVGGQVTIAQLLSSGRLAPQDLAGYTSEMSSRLAEQSQPGPMITLQVETGQQAETDSGRNYLAYLAPGMAVFFLMYTVTQGGRSILAERDMGTLARLLSTPTSRAVFLGGKVLSIFAAGFIQVGGLVLASSLLFGLRWGDPLAVVLLVTSVVAAATGWGILLASFARTPWQVASVGSAIMLLFGLLGGLFIPISSFSGVVRLFSKITPNAWANDGFTMLSRGGSLAEIVTPILALLAMAVVLFTVSIVFSRRRWISGFAKS